MGERWLCKPEVGGSSPPTSTIHFLTFPAIKGTNRRPTGAGGRIPPHLSQTGGVQQGRRPCVEGGSGSPLGSGATSEAKERSDVGG